MWILKTEKREYQMVKASLICGYDELKIPPTNYTNHNTPTIYTILYARNIPNI